jgi:hypothetical protein
MSTFKWDISEPAEDAASTTNGGIVQLDDLKAGGMTSGWSVTTPDNSVELVPQQSGEVELTKQRQARPIISNAVWNFAVIMLVLVIAFMIFKDVRAGTLTLERFLWLVVPPLTGHLAGRK